MSTQYENLAIELNKKHQFLAPIVEQILRSIFDKNQIDLFSISYRVKAINSILEKIERKKYKDPNSQLTDISGIRIICYFEHEIESIRNIIEKSFEISKKHSSDKSKSLSIDKIGYRSHHYVAQLGENRSKSPEYSDICDLQFEIQIRTVLQHSWAVISHDRNYKFSQKLPDHIERKLNLFAGLLEIADNGFNEVICDIENYSRSISEKITRKEDVGINSISLINFIENITKENNYQLADIGEKESPEISDLISELKYFGVTTISDVEKIIPKSFFENSKKFNYSTNIFGLIRDWLVIKDSKKMRDYPERYWCFDEEEFIKENILVYKEYMDAHTAESIPNEFFPTLDHNEDEG